MQIIISDILPRDEALALGEVLARSGWIDGNATSGPAAALAKRNRQLPETSPAAAAARARIEAALAQNVTFLSAALPRALFPPLFNAYGPGEGFGAHVDNAIRRTPAGEMLRTDLSATLFLSEDYDGGALNIHGPSGAVSHTLPAGHMVLYPSTSLHNVTPVSRGSRIACFFWLQSLVRDHDAREMLFDLDQAIQTLTAEHGGTDATVLRLTKVYHNLVRHWAEC